MWGSKIKVGLIITLLLGVMLSGSVVTAATIQVPTDHAKISDAVATASAGDVIEIAAGTYTENAQIEITKNLTIRGASGTNSSNVIIDGEDTHRIFYVTENIEATLNGLTMQNGFVEDDNGSAIKVTVNVTLNISDVQFLSNEADDTDSSGGNSYGGAIYAPDNSAMFIIDDCYIYDNRAGWQSSYGYGGFASGGTWTVTNSLIKSNSTNGGWGGVANAGVWSVEDSIFEGNGKSQNTMEAGVAYYGTWTATNCTFNANNSGFGGVAKGGTWQVLDCYFEGNYGGVDGGIAANSDWNVTGSVFENNFCYSGGNAGGIGYSGTWRVVNSIFDSNYSDSWPGGVASGGTWTAINSTFYGNYSAYGGIAFGGTWTATNCIFWGNHDNGGGETLFTGAATITYSDVQPDDWVAGAGNVSADPLFVSTANSNFRLQTSPTMSPAIDAGTSNVSVTTDIEGSSRPQGYAYDMGAYESPSSNPLFNTDSPTINLVDPTANETTVSVDVDIIFELTDVIAGVSTASLMVTINGELAVSAGASTDTNTYNIAFTSITDGYRVSIDPTGIFESLSVVTINLYVEDIGGLASSLDYVFTTAPDTEDPYIRGLDLTGLILWNKMGSRAEMESSEVGTNFSLSSGSDTVYTWLPGMFGNSWKNQNESWYATLSASSLDSREGCIEFWYQLKGVDGNRYPYIDSMSGQTIYNGQWHLLITPDGGLNTRRIRFAIYWKISDVQYSFWHDVDESDTPFGWNNPGEWRHYAFAWDKDGSIEGQYNYGIYINNTFISGNVVEIPEQKLGHSRVLRFGKAYYNYSFAENFQNPIDNFKAWDYAKTDFSGRFSEHGYTNTPFEDQQNVSITQNIEFILQDVNSGIASNSIRVTVDGVEYVWPDDYPAIDLTATDNGYAVVIDPPTNNYNQTITVSIYAEDNFSNSVGYSYPFTTIAMIAPVDPLDEESDFPVESDLVFDVSSNLGVVSGSIRVTLNGVLAISSGESSGTANYLVSVEPITDGYRGSIDPVVLLPELSTNTINVYAEDIFGNYEELEYTFDTAQDPVPEIILVDPLADDTSIVVETDITWQVTDNELVDTQSIMVTINDVLVVSNSISVDTNSYNITISDLPAINGYQVSVSLVETLPAATLNSVEIYIEDMEANAVTLAYTFTTDIASVHNISFPATRDYTTIQGALNEAEAQHTIELDAGTYSEAMITWPDTTGITLRGSAGTNSTNIILKGATYKRIFGIYNPVTVNLQGLSIVSGNGTTYGGAIYITANASVYITDVVFNDNYNYGSGSWMVYAGGGAIYNRGKLEVLNSRFNYNRVGQLDVIQCVNSLGGAIYSNGSLNVENCTFENNVAAGLNGTDARGYGGAICNESPGVLTVDRALFCSNNAQGWEGAGTKGAAGGGVYSDSQVLIKNSILCHNNVSHRSGGDSYGGAAYFIGATTINSCTTYDNDAATAWDGIYSNANVQVLNSILWDTAGQNLAGSSIASYSDIRLSSGTFTGAGNINADPQFVDADNNDFSLSTSPTRSPAIDVGSSDGVPTNDINGNPRYRGSGYDMGAYENQDILLALGNYSYTDENGGTENITATTSIVIEGSSGNVVIASVGVDPIELGFADIFQVDFSDIIVTKNEYGLPQISISATGDLGATVNNASGAIYVPITLGPFSSPPIITVSTGNGFVQISGYDGSIGSGAEASRVTSYNYDEGTDYVSFYVNEFSTYGSAIISTVNLTDLPVSADARTTVNFIVEVLDTNGENIEAAPVTINIVSGSATVYFPDGNTTNVNGTLNVEISFSTAGTNDIEAYCDAVTSDVSSILIEQVVTSINNITQGTYYDTIIAAVADADPGDEIELLAGTYQEGDQVTIDVSLTIRGASGTNSSNVIIDGDSTGDGQGDHRVFTIAENALVTINDLTIQNGQAIGVGLGIQIISGSLYMENVQALNCTANGSYPNGRGGFISVASGQEATANHCLFSGNYATSRGGTIYNAGGFFYGEYNIFENSHSGDQGGMLYMTGSSYSVHNSIYRNNRTGNRGGALNIQGNYTGHNNLFVDNRSTGAEAGALSIGNTTAVMNNNTFVRNIANSTGGAIYCSQGSLSGNNNIFFGNHASSSSQIFNGNIGSTSIIFKYSCMPSGNAGTNQATFEAQEGNITADPLFVDYSNDDFTLQLNSPAINSGTEDVTVATDINGVPRGIYASSPGYDMGAYEYDNMYINENNPERSSGNVSLSEIFSFRLRDWYHLVSGSAEVTVNINGAEYYGTSLNIVDSSGTTTDMTVSVDLTLVYATTYNVTIDAQCVSESIQDVYYFVVQADPNPPYITGGVGQEGLILWNKLGSDAQVTASEVGEDFTIGGTPAYEAVEFDDGARLVSASEILSIANMAGFNKDEGTVEMWFKFKGSNTGITEHVDMWMMGENSNLRFYAYQDINQDAIMFHSHGGTVGTLASVKSSLSSWNDGDIKHVAFVWNKDWTSKRARIYFDGVDVSAIHTYNNDWTSSDFSSDEFQLGYTIASASEADKGVFDNIKVYNYAKTDFSDRFVEAGYSTTPYAGQTDVPLTQNIEFTLIDEDTYISTDSIKVTVNGALYEDPNALMTLTATTNGIEVVIDPPTYNYAEVITVDIYAEDSGGNPVTYSYLFTTIIDSTAPTTSGLYPVKSSTGNALDTNLAFHIYDLESDVDTSSIRLDVDDIDVSGQLSVTLSSIGGQVGGASVYDGSGDIVRVSVDASFDVTSTLTLEAWAKYDSDFTGYIFEKTTNHYALLTYAADSGKVSFFIVGLNDPTLKTMNSYSDGNWHHFVATYDKDGGSDNMKIYVDGQLENSATRTGSITTGGNTFTMGNVSSGVWPWDGFIDEARVYQRVLNPTEVLNSYQRGERHLASDNDPADLAAYWSFDDTSDTVTANDDSGNGLDGLYINEAHATGNAAWLVEYDPASDFSYGETVEVTINASNNSGTAMAANAYSFTTESDPNPPYIFGGDQSNLVFWNKLGSDNEVGNSEVGVDGVWTGSANYSAVKYNDGAYSSANTKYVLFNDFNTAEANDLEKFAIEFWFKTDYAVSNGQAQDGNYHFLWDFYMDASNRYQIGISSSAGEGIYMQRALEGYYACTSPTASWSADTVHHFAVVVDKDGIDGGAEKTRFYLDGEKIYSNGSYFSGLTATSDLAVLINYNGGVTAYPLNGAMDNFKVWNYAKTDYSDRFGEAGLYTIPYIDQTEVPLTQNIEFTLVDDDTYISTDSIKVTVNGALYEDPNALMTLTATTNGIEVVVDPPTYNYGETITVDIYAEDSGGNPVTYSYSFTAMDDPNPPYITGGIGQEGLLLWNKLGSAAEITSSDVGPDFVINNTLEYLPAKFSDGFASDTTGYTSADITGMFSDNNSGTVEFWFKPEQDSSWYSGSQYQALFDMTYDSDNYLMLYLHEDLIQLSCEANNVILNIANSYTWSADELLHVAAVWDSSGINGTSENIAIYVNGEKQGTNNGTLNFTGNFTSSQMGYLTYLGPYYSADTIVDNLKIYDHAKTDFSNRFVETGLGPVPYNGQTDVPLTQNIEFTLIDEDTYISTSSIQVTVDGVAYDENSGEVTLTPTTNGIGIVIDPPTYNYGDAITVDIYAEDSGGNPVTYSYSFTAETDPNPPYISGGDRSGLMLWNKLGSVAEVQNSEIGPDLSEVGNIQYFDAKFGNGCALNDANSRTQPVAHYVKVTGSVLNTANGCVELWVNIKNKPEWGPLAVGRPEFYYFLGGHRVDVPDDITYKRFGFYANETITTELQSINFYGTTFDENNYDGIYAREPGFTYDTGIHHLAAVWDASGIDGSSEKQRLYFDGQVIATGDITITGTEPPEYLPLGGATYYGAGLGNQENFAVDNIKVWDYAKTDFSDRFSEAGYTTVPYADQVNVPLTQNIEFSLIDDDTYISTDSIRVTVNGTLYEDPNALMTLTPTTNGIEVVIDPPTYNYAEVITVDIYAEDSGGNPVAYSYSFTAIPVPDSTGPTIDPISPLAGEVAIPKAIDIVFNVTDDIVGVAIDTLIVTVDGTLVTDIVSSSGVEGYRVTCDVATFNYGQVVTVDIYIEDSF
ncbi:LamG-like jellyroll fold domain-containing protein, partial [Candidatus Margulisiibacteriota bacterium]